MNDQLVVAKMTVTQIIILTYKISRKYTSFHLSVAAYTSWWHMDVMVFHLTHWDRDKIAAISQTTVSKVFCRKNV